MTPTRGDFLKTAGAVGAAPTPKKLLVLGGTGFIGPRMVRYAMERGHEVTIFTRGRSGVRSTSSLGGSTC